MRGLASASAATRRIAPVLFVVTWMAAPVSAHVPGIVTPDNVWTTWSLEPLVLMTVAVISWVYARGVRRLWSTAARDTCIKRLELRVEAFIANFQRGHGVSLFATDLSLHAVQFG